MILGGFREGGLNRFNSRSRRLAGGQDDGFAILDLLGGLRDFLRHLDRDHDCTVLVGCKAPGAGIESVKAALAKAAEYH